MKISLAYAVCGGTWVLLSDFILATFFTGPEIQYLQIAKGWGFVLLSTAFLYWIIDFYRRALCRNEERFDDMIQCVSATTGEAFFNLLTQNMCQTLNADYAFIGELAGKNKESVRTVAIYAEGRDIENFEFKIDGTPCDQVVKKGLRSYSRDVQKLFPLDHVAEEMGVESYVGIPLFDSQGKVIGPLAVLGRRPMKDIHLAEKMLKVFAVRAAAELERTRSEKTIAYMAYYDPLTGLANKRLFYDRVQQALPYARRNGRFPAVLFLDLDRFKNINDTLGHEAGDRVLKEVAGRLLASLRQEDTVARLGGDEFLILLPHIQQAEDVGQVAQKLIESFRKPFQAEDFELHLAASIGIAIFPLDGESPDVLLKNADTALHRAKELGRNNYQFYLSEMNASSLQRLGLENELRKALSRNEMQLHFQPQYQLEGRKMTGLEALVRWKHPDRGLVPPGEFIPLAEETGLIIPLGEWVLRAACTQARIWQKAGLDPFRVAVNISARQFHQYDLVSLVGEILCETQLDARWLELEITESLIMQDVEGAVVKLAQLRDLGVHIAIDDFGTGYSSLSYLKKFPIQTLKIDRSFVRDLSVSGDDAAIVNAVIALAHSLSMDVVAEGVETEEQLNLLGQKGCDRVQGFLLSKPRPEEEIGRMFGAMKNEAPPLSIAVAASRGTG